MIKLPADITLVEPGLDLDDIRDYLDQIEGETERMRAELEEFKVAEQLFNEKMALGQKIIASLLSDSTDLKTKLRESKEANKFFLHKFAETCRKDPNLKARMQSLDPFWKENERLFEVKSSRRSAESNQ